MNIRSALIVAFVVLLIFVAIISVWIGIDSSPDEIRSNGILSSNLEFTVLASNKRKSDLAIIRQAETENNDVILDSRGNTIAHWVDFSLVGNPYIRPDAKLESDEYILKKNNSGDIKVLVINDSNAIDISCFRDVQYVKNEDDRQHGIILLLNDSGKNKIVSILKNKSVVDEISRRKHIMFGVTMDNKIITIIDVAIVNPFPDGIALLVDYNEEDEMNKSFMMKAWVESLMKEIHGDAYVNDVSFDPEMSESDPIHVFPIPFGQEIRDLNTNFDEIHDNIQ